MSIKQKNPAHPGEVLQGLYVEPLGLSQAKLAAHLHTTRAAINEILNGRRGISPEMAFKLADVLNTTPQLWLNLQTAWDLHQAAKKHRKLPPLTFDCA